ncbi:amidase [Endozoicomonas sp. 4G]|uniref:amidase n=1 Tax=Endozoicomonas sp. 4G TaxID=2872754 RepID=UPI002078707C|nr:amidase [Endozoicomonas sp. 4G]
MRFSGLALVFTLLLTATGSYGHNLSDPALVEIYNPYRQKPYITKYYYPDWLSASQNLSGSWLSLTRDWVIGHGSIDEQVEIVKSQLVMTGISPEDPVLFSEAELASLSLNAGIADKPQRAPFELIPSEEKGSAGSPTVRISELFGRAGGIDEIQQWFAEQKISPSILVEIIYYWYEKGLPPGMKDILIARNKDQAMSMAKVSDQRWLKCISEYKGNIEVCKKQGIISELEGIPIAVKSEINVAGYHATAGADLKKITDQSLFPIITEETESEVIRLLKREGVIILGLTNQHFFGLGATGENPHFPRTANHFNPFHVAGGSSTGSALMVAIGMSPLTVGTDGGGSVSIPASLNGLPGLKPTTDKLSTKNYVNAALSLVAIGLIGKRFKDIALGYQVSSGRHPTLQVAEALKTLKIGLDRDWLEHADKEVSEKTFECLDRLGTRLKKLQNRKDNIFVKMHFTSENFRKRLWATHIILFGSWAAEGSLKFLGKGIPYETEMALLMGKALTNEQAERARQNQKILADHFEKNIFSKVDVIAMPTTLIPAPEKLAYLLNNTAGELNLAKAYLLSFNTSLANLTGGPRVTIPCGFNHEDLPFGLQLMGAVDSEYLLLALGSLLEEEMHEELSKKADQHAFQPLKAYTGAIRSEL